MKHNNISFSGTFAVVSLMTSKVVKMYEQPAATQLEEAGVPGNWTLDPDGLLENIPAKLSVLIAVAFCVGIWQVRIPFFSQRRF